MVVQGDDLVLRRKAAPKRTIDVSGFAGKAPGIQLAPREDFDESDARGMFIGLYGSMARGFMGEGRQNSEGVDDG